MFYVCRNVKERRKSPRQPNRRECHIVILHFLTEGSLHFQPNRYKNQDCVPGLEKSSSSQNLLPWNCPANSAEPFGGHCCLAPPDWTILSPCEGFLYYSRCRFAGNQLHELRVCRAAIAKKHDPINSDCTITKTYARLRFAE
jgi:hypothetical protein